MTTPIAERAAGQSAELVQLYRDFELRTLDDIVVGGGTAGCVQGNQGSFTFHDRQRVRAGALYAPS